jgi:hypothetical protein
MTHEESNAVLTVWFWEPEEKGSKVSIRRRAPHYTGSGDIIARRVELFDAKRIVEAMNRAEREENALQAPRSGLT